MINIKRDYGIVLNSYKWRETSLLLKIFTRQHGIISLIAKGVRRRNSIMRAAVQVFNFSEIVFLKKENLNILKEAKVILPFEFEHFKVYEFTSKFSYIISNILPENTRASDIFNIFLGFLKNIKTSLVPVKTFDIYLIKLMENVGIFPDLHRCGICGSTHVNSFRPHEFVVVCKKCYNKQVDDIKLLEYMLNPFHEKRPDSMDRIIIRGLSSYALDMKKIVGKSKIYAENTFKP